MKKLSAVILCIMACAFSLAAQTKGSVSGKLVDENGNPVEFANIVLKNGNETVNGGISDGNGEFKFEVAEGQYTLEATSVGYETLTIMCRPCDLGELTMPKNIEQLESAVVNSSRTTEKGGKYVVVPDPVDAKAAAKGVDLLAMQQLPGLRVDRALQSITIDGGTPVLLINGKEVSNTRLCNLNPEHIKRIEYSNNPGIRYIDRGAAGVINIILKEAEDGGSINTNAESAFTTGFVNAYFNGRYHKGKSEFSAEYYFSYRNYKKNPAIMETKYIDDARLVERSSEQNNPFHYSIHNVNLEYTFQANDSTMFIASLKNDYMDNEAFGSGTMKNTDRGIRNDLEMDRSRKMKNSAPTLDLFYIMALPNSQKIELNAVSVFNISDQSDITTYKLADGNNIYDHTVNNRGIAISTEGVYSKVFGSIGTRWGVQYQYNLAKNDYVPYSIISKMVKNNTYIYGQVTGTIGEKANWDLGTGAKIFAVNDGSSKVVYVRNLTTAQINWRITQKLSLTANSSYTPELPSLGDLSPIMQQTDDVEAVQGNASLKPSTSLNSRVMLRYNGDKGLYFNVVGGYYHTFSPIITTYTYMPSLDLFMSTPQNAAFQNRAFGGFEIGVHKLFKHINLSYSGTYKREESKGEGFNHVNNNYCSNIDFQAVWEKFLVGAYFNITPEWSLLGELLGQSERGQSIYAQYNWKNLSVNLSWHCPFNKMGYDYCTKSLSEVHPFTGTNWTVENGNMIVLGLTWNFEFGKAFNKGNKTLWNGGYDAGTVH